MFPKYPKESRINFPPRIRLSESRISAEAKGDAKGADAARPSLAEDTHGGRADAARTSGDERRAADKRESDAGDGKGYIGRGFILHLRCVAGIG